MTKDNTIVSKENVAEFCSLSILCSFFSISDLSPGLKRWTLSFDPGTTITAFKVPKSGSRRIRLKFYHWRILADILLSLWIESRKFNHIDPSCKKFLATLQSNGIVTEREKRRGIFFIKNLLNFWQGWLFYTLEGFLKVFPQKKLPHYFLLLQFWNLVFFASGKFLQHLRINMNSSKKVPFTSEMENQIIGRAGSGWKANSNLIMRHFSLGAYTLI